MNIGDIIQPPSQLASSRFFRTSYLPTYAAAIFLLILTWSGAPGRPIEFSRAWKTANHLGVIDVLLILLVVTVIALLLQPLQLGIVRVLEGGFPRWLGSGLASRLQKRRKNRLKNKANELLFKATQQRLDDENAARNEYIQSAGLADARHRARFPGTENAVRATALGNALAAMESSAGAPYGLDTVVIWPRLYPILSDQVRGIVDDLRDGMDAAVRLAATSVVTSAAAAALLAWHSGWRTLIALAPLVIAYVAYAGAVQAALSYGVAVHMAFDLHRFDLLKKMQLPLPKDPSEEWDHNLQLSDFLRQSVPVRISYSPDSSVP